MTLWAMKSTKMNVWVKTIPAGCWRWFLSSWNPKFSSGRYLSNPFRSDFKLRILFFIFINFYFAIKPGHFQDHNDHHDSYEKDNSTERSSYNPNLVLEIQIECLHVKIRDIWDILLTNLLPRQCGINIRELSKAILESYCCKIFCEIVISTADNELENNSLSLLLSYVRRYTDLSRQMLCRM